MEDLKDANPGFRSRIQHDFDLEPYSPWDLKEIFNIMVKHSSEKMFLEACCELMFSSFLCFVCTCDAYID